MQSTNSWMKTFAINSEDPILYKILKLWS